MGNTNAKGEERVLLKKMQNLSPTNDSIPHWRSTLLQFLRINDVDFVALDDLDSSILKTLCSQLAIVIGGGGGGDHEEEGLEKNLRTHSNSKNDHDDNKDVDDEDYIMDQNVDDYHNAPLQLILLKSMTKLLHNPYLYKKCSVEGRVVVSTITPPLSSSIPAVNDNSSVATMGHDDSGVDSSSHNESLDNELPKISLFKFPMDQIIVAPVATIVQQGNPSFILEALKMIQCVVGRFVSLNLGDGDDVRDHFEVVDNEIIADMKYVFVRSGGLQLLGDVLKFAISNIGTLNDDEQQHRVSEDILVLTLNIMREFVSDSAKVSTSEDVYMRFMRFFCSPFNNANYDSYFLSDLLPLMYGKQYKYVQSMLRSTASSLIKDMLQESTPAMTTYMMQSSVIYLVVLRELELMIQVLQRGDNNEMNELMNCIELIQLFSSSIQPDVGNENRAILSNVLPKQLCTLLFSGGNRSEFIEAFSSNIRSSSLIWNDTTRNELFIFVVSETQYCEKWLNQLKQIPLDTFDFLVNASSSISLEYKSLKNELQTGGLYIYALVEQIHRSKSVIFEIDGVVIDELFEQVVVFSMENAEELTHILSSIRVFYRHCAKSYLSTDLRRHVRIICHLLGQNSSKYYLSALLKLFETLLLVTSSPSSLLEHFLTHKGDSHLFGHVKRIQADFIGTDNSITPLDKTALISILSIICRLCAVIPRFTMKLLEDDTYHSTIINSLLLKDLDVTDATLVFVEKWIESAKPFSLEFESRLYQTGIFEFLLYNLKVGCTRTMAIFLSVFESKQEGHESYLNRLLPSRVTSLLYTPIRGWAYGDNIDHFCNLFNGKGSPFSLWSQRDALALHSNIDKLLLGYIRDFRGDARFTSSSTIIEYEQPENQVEINGFYVSQIAQMEDEDLVDISEPEVLLQQLIRYSCEHKMNQTILEAQIKLFRQISGDTRSIPSEVCKYPLFPQLLQDFVGFVTKVKGESVGQHKTKKGRKQKVSKEATEGDQQTENDTILLSELLATIFELPDDISRDNKLLFMLEHQGFSILSDQILDVLSHKCYSTLINMIRIMSSLSTVLSHMEISTAVMPSDVYSRLSVLFSSDMVSNNPELALWAITAETQLIQRRFSTEPISELAIRENASFFVRLLEIGILYRQFNSSGDEDGDLSQMKKSVCLTAIQLLQAVWVREQGDTLKQLVQRLLSKKVFDLFQSVPNPLRRRLNHDDVEEEPVMSLNNFFEFVRCDPRFASYVWNEKMRTLLQEFVTQFYAQNLSGNSFWEEFSLRFSNESQQ